MNHDVNHINDDSGFKDLVKDYLEQKRKQRRRRSILRLFIWGGIILAIIFSASNVQNKEKPHTAFIDIKGNIFEGSQASAQNIVKAIHTAYRAKGMKDVIFRINSGGGSPVQADYIYQEIMRFRHKYPKIKVYAVCSDLCASAAYYIAAAANDIYASRASLVGSIGVLYNGFGLVGTMDKLGVTRRLITAGKNKGFLDPFSPELPADKEKMDVMLEVVHQVFENSVKEGRGARLIINDDTFSGLFWTGQQAKPMGLIDGFGNEWDLLREKTHSKKYINYTIKSNLLDRVSKQLGSEALMGLLEKLGVNAPLL